jgi:hypothetical protein
LERLVTTGGRFEPKVVTFAAAAEARDARWDVAWQSAQELPLACGGFVGASLNLEGQFDLESLRITEKDLVKRKPRHWALVEGDLPLLQEADHFVQTVARESDMVQWASLFDGPSFKQARQVNDCVAIAVQPVAGKIEAWTCTFD